MPPCYPGGAAAATLHQFALANWHPNQRHMEHFLFSCQRTNTNLQPSDFQQPPYIWAGFLKTGPRRRLLKRQTQPRGDNFLPLYKVLYKTPSLVISCLSIPCHAMRAALQAEATSERGDPPCFCLATMPRLLSTGPLSLLSRHPRPIGPASAQPGDALATSGDYSLIPHGCKVCNYLSQLFCPARIVTVHPLPGDREPADAESPLRTTAFNPCLVKAQAPAHRTPGRPHRQASAW